LIIIYLTSKLFNTNNNTQFPWKLIKRRKLEIFSFLMILLFCLLIMRELKLLRYPKNNWKWLWRSCLKGIMWNLWISKVKRK